jgi:hypothetical protein
LPDPGAACQVADDPPAGQRPNLHQGGHRDDQVFPGQLRLPAHVHHDESKPVGELLAAEALDLSGECFLLAAVFGNEQIQDRDIDGFSFAHVASSGVWKLGGGESASRRERFAGFPVTDPKPTHFRRRPVGAPPAPLRVLSAC